MLPFLLFILQDKYLSIYYKYNYNLESLVFVLRRYDRNPEISWLFASYRETVQSTKTNLNGIEACTIFIESEFARTRALKLGWKDETELYNKSIEEELKKHEEEKSAKVNKKVGRPKKTKKTKS